MPCTHRRVCPAHRAAWSVGEHSPWSLSLGWVCRAQGAAVQSASGHTSAPGPATTEALLECEQPAGMCGAGGGAGGEEGEQGVIKAQGPGDGWHSGGNIHVQVSVRRGVRTKDTVMKP